MDPLEIQVASFGTVNIAKVNTAKSPNKIKSFQSPRALLVQERYSSTIKRERKQGTGAKMISTRAL